MKRPAIDEPGVVGAVLRFWQRTYAADYVGFALLLAAYLCVQFFGVPFHRMFSLDDHAKQYPYALVQRVSSGENILYAGVTPLVLIILWALVSRPGVHKVHVTILGLLISLFLTSLITDIIKNAVGRPRPDLIARCMPRKGTPEHELVTIDVCTQSDLGRLNDGWRSFPSGHSSWAFAGLGYFALFLAGQMHVLRPHSDLARVLITIIPLLGAALIAMSRLADYRHDVFDVTCGSLLGMTIAWFSYRRYYRSLYHSKCYEPYPSRGEIVLDTRPKRPRDIEARINEEFSDDDLSEDEAQVFPLTDSRPESSRKQTDHQASP